MGILVDLVKYLGILFIGGLVGFNGLIRGKLSDNLDKVQSICLLFLLFVMGITIGLDEEVVSNLVSIGFKALVISIFTIVFSVIAVSLIKKFVHIEGDKDES